MNNNCVTENVKKFIESILKKSRLSKKRSKRENVNGVSYNLRNTTRT